MKKNKLSDKYEVGLMSISILVIILTVGGLTLFPTKGKFVAGKIMYILTQTFGSSMQIISALIMLFLIGLAFSKYGEIRLGNEKPQFKTLSWVAMMFFCGNGAGTVYWAFLEWGHHFNASPNLFGTSISEAYNYEQSLAYTMFDWGPLAWSLLCVFVLPFAYHYYIKKDNELRFSILTKYSVGEKHARGIFGKFVDFIFIFAAVGSICITAGASASTIAAAIASLFGFKSSFGLTVGVLLGVAVLYSASSLLGIEKGMRKISDWNVYFCISFLLFIALAGPTKFILDSITNSIGLLSTNFVRMMLWTDPVAKSNYPQNWTVFYLVYWFVFGPFTGLFVAKISKGRKIKEVIANMLLSGTSGLLFFFGIVTAYQQNLRVKGILDVPKMLLTGQAENIAEATINTLPFAKIAMVLYLIVIILFLATTLDACSFTLSSTVSKNLKEGEEPRQSLKFVWCIVLVLLPIAISYIQTDINTIKAIVLSTGFPLVIILGIIYHGFLKEMTNDYKDKTKDDIIRDGKLD